MIIRKNVTEMASVVSMMTVSGTQQREAGSGKLYGTSA